MEETYDRDKKKTFEISRMEAAWLINECERLDSGLFPVLDDLSKMLREAFY